MPSERAPSMENVWRELGRSSIWTAARSSPSTWPGGPWTRLRARVGAGLRRGAGRLRAVVADLRHSLDAHYVVFVRVDGSFLYFNDLHHDAAHQHLS